ncbi:MAG: sensor histidine kinase [Candidatus Pristimantibacillus sp.]
MKTWLEKWRNPIRFRKIRSRYLATMIMLSVPPLFLLGLISFNVSKETIMESNTQTNMDTLRTSSEVADLMFRNAINLNRSIILNDRIRDNLRLLKEDQMPITEAAVKTEVVNELQKMINNGFINSRFVDSICLLDLNHEAYCLGRSDNTGIYSGNNKLMAIEQSEWYQRAKVGNGRVIFINNDVLSDSSKTFSTVKLFRDSGSADGEPLGMLIINISKSIFDSFFSGSKKYGGEFIALDTSGDMIEVVQPPRSKELQAVLQGDEDEVAAAFKQLGYLTVTYPNETTDWSFIHLVEIKELLKESNRIGTATALIAFIIAFVAIAISYLISGSITRPLLQVKKMMVEWARGQREFNENFADDEVGAIGETFKRMAVENKELNEKLVHTELREREAELKALQAQIKPHFLYNTLDSIYWMATLKKNEEAAQMTLALSQSFKLSLNKGKDMIPVSKELEHIHHYMTIQNIRYNNRFEYMEDVEPAVKGMEILKLLLQPLVENAIYHGLEPKIGKGTVTLTGKREDDYLLFIIEDDGVGIEDSSKIDEGYGLRNVKERLSMYYGPMSTIQITSRPNMGTRILLKLQIRG